MRTQEAFTISILDCANRLNLKFKRTYMNPDGLREHIFHCPLRTDTNASLYINETKNVWYDNGGISDGGGIIHFINYLHGNYLDDTSSALRILDGIYPELKYPSKQLVNNTRKRIQRTSSPLVSHGKKEKSVGTFEVLEVKEIFSYPLKNYLRDDRKINLDIAKSYVKEIVHRHVGKNIIFYGIGFKSGNTWVIRRKGFKGFLGKGADITILDRETSNILIFEGFIDFLSYLTAKNIKSPSESVIVLNSAVFMNRAIEFIKSKDSITSIDYFCDRDETGKQSLDRLRDGLANITISDKSEFYSNYKDLNEWLINEYTRT